MNFLYSLFQLRFENIEKIRGDLPLAYFYNIYEHDKLLRKIRPHALESFLVDTLIMINELKMQYIIILIF